MIKLERLALILGFGLAAACGGESDEDEDAPGGAPAAGSPGSLSTGLPPTAVVEDVTPAQYAGACASLREDVNARLGPDEAVRGACEAFGGILLNAPDECRSSADGCVVQTNNGTHPFLNRESLDLTTFECGDTSELQGCNVTIGELESCLNDRMALLEGLLEDNNCDNAASVDLMSAMQLTNFGANASPASCTEVEAQCPNAGPLATPQ